jgi:hypothetical protein
VDLFGRQTDRRRTGLGCWRQRSLARSWDSGWPAVGGDKQAGKQASKQQRQRQRATRALPDRHSLTTEQSPNGAACLKIWVGMQAEVERTCVVGRGQTACSTKTHLAASVTANPRGLVWLQSREITDVCTQVPYLDAIS